MTKLYVIGDSFSAIEVRPHSSKAAKPYPEYDYGTSIYWPKQLADKLGADLINLSKIGCSQDFEWHNIYEHRDQITPDDYVVIVLTEINRFWYLDNSPEFSRPDLLLQYPDLQGVGDTAMQFSRYIQRDSLTVLNLENRLGALSYIAHTQCWRNPLVLYAMSQISDVERYFNNLDFSKGTLTDLAINEVGIGVNQEYYNNKIIKGIDPRYNHLTMSNHKILVDKLYNYFTENTPVDLTTNFLNSVLTETSLTDPNFHHELSPGAMYWRSTIGKEWQLWKNFGINIL
jgi:hypothetical protein